MCLRQWIPWLLRSIARAYLQHVCSTTPGDALQQEVKRHRPFCRCHRNEVNFTQPIEAFLVVHREETEKVLICVHFIDHPEPSKVRLIPFNSFSAFNLRSAMAAKSNELFLNRIGIIYS